MLRTICLLATAVVLVSASARAGDIDLKVSALPKNEKDKADLRNNTSLATSKGYYKVKVKNLSLMNDVPELTASYRIYFKQDDGKTNPRDLPIKADNGETKLAAIKRGGEATFETKRITLRTRTLNPNFYYTDGSRSGASDEVVGIWIKIFQGTELVTEFALPASMMKDQKF